MSAAFFITDTSIKVGKPRQKSISHFEYPLQNGIVVDGYIKNEQEFGKTLSHIVSQLGLNKASVILGIAEKYVYNKKLKISLYQDNSKDEVIKEIESYLPTPASESYIDWQRVEKHDNGEIIFFSSAPTDLLSLYLKLFDAAKLQIVAIEPIPSALARAVALAEKVTSLIIFLDGNDVNLVIIDNHGCLELTSVVQRATLENKDAFIGLVRQMFTFFQKKQFSSEEKQETVQKVYLSGNGTTTQMANAISSELSLPVSLVGTPGLIGNEAVSFFDIYALLSFQPVYPKDHEYINLLPEDVLSARHMALAGTDIKKWLNKTTLYTFILSLIVAGIVGYTFITSSIIDSHIAEQKKLLEGTDITSITNRVKTINKEASLIDKTRITDDTGMNMVTYITTKTPPGISISHYTVDLDKNLIVLTGQAKSRDTLLQFQKQLETSNLFQNIKVPLTSLETLGTSSFTITFERKEE